jgi:hypothetical protein
MESAVGVRIDSLQKSKNAARPFNKGRGGGHGAAGAEAAGRDWRSSLAWVVTEEVGYLERRAVTSFRASSFFP